MAIQAGKGHVMSFGLYKLEGDTFMHYHPAGPGERPTAFDDFDKPDSDAGAGLHLRMEVE